MPLDAVVLAVTVVQFYSNMQQDIDDGDSEYGLTAQAHFLHGEH